MGVLPPASLAAPLKEISRPLPTPRSGSPRVPPRDIPYPLLPYINTPEEPSSQGHDLATRCLCLLPGHLYGAHQFGYSATPKPVN